MLRKKTKNLTQKQKQIFDFICDYLDKNDFSPTITELAKFLGVSSLRTVTQHLEALEKKNLISRIRHQGRGIRLLNDAGVIPQTVALPVISCAGCDNMDVFAQELYDEYITVDRSFLHGKKEKDVVLIKAVGDSMVEAGISNGDLVLTEKTSDISQKDNVVAVVDGMAVIKNIFFLPNAVILRPMSNNSQYRPIIMQKDFQVFGKVINVIKEFSGNDELEYENI